MPWAAAASTSSVIRPRPSSRLNSEWTWRWVKSLGASVTDGKSTGRRATGRGADLEADRMPPGRPADRSDRDRTGEREAVLHALGFGPRCLDGDRIGRARDGRGEDRRTGSRDRRGLPAAADENVVDGQVDRGPVGRAEPDA